MKKAEYWKNFKLGKELDIAGRFIYNGLQNFHQMDNFYYEEEIFELFYNLSVGFERLLKITVIMIEHHDDMDQKQFEKSLITHNHLELLERIKKKHSLPFSSLHNEFLQILSKFYKTDRYGNYDLLAMKVDGEEKTSLHSFLENRLNITIEEDWPFLITKNDDRIKKFIGKIIGKIACEVYGIIKLEANRLNISTYEIRTDSKASKIFQFKEVTFVSEDVLWKELLIFFMNTKEENGLISFMRDVEPLAFDPALATDYLDCFKSDVNKLTVMEELDHLYEEDVDDIKSRLQGFELIGNPNVHFDKEEEEEVD